MRAILLGMNNPYGADPEYALFPAPEGCAGHRLWQLLREGAPGVLRQQYLDAFDRRNLVAGVWSMATARAVAENFDPPRGSTVVVLGAGPRDALRLPEGLVHPHVRGGVTYRQLPHPSGRNPWYNHPTHRLVAGLLLAELYAGSQ